ncbi:MAG TPA: succinate dehydrogenase/fumarate reductase iron-sulfur subunit [Candidatus Thermoplasmatota archaeon]|nr:succinate dehydrogenase/fumarate reductase iron-sulfur subunit [Candidatus Thermoplasmatota archaeon]
MARDVTVEQLTASKGKVVVQKAKVSKVRLRVQRGDPGQTPTMQEFEVEVEEGMVVLDAVHRIQEHQAEDLACRWNCKAGKCGSCSAEIDGKPRLMCMARLDDFAEGEPITITPVRTFPVIKDLVTDVSWNYAVNKRIPPFQHGKLSAEEQAKGELRMTQADVDRVQEFRKCIECFLCQDVCHVLRDAAQPGFYGPRFMIRIASLEMHPKDAVDRTALAKEEAGVGYCNITKCCTEVCPEHIKITDNGIIPLKERVADRYYDPVQMLWRAVKKKG